MVITYPVLEADLANFRVAVSNAPTVFISNVTSVEAVPPPGMEHLSELRHVYLHFSDPRDLIMIGIMFRQEAEADRAFSDSERFAAEEMLSNPDPANNNR